MFDETDFAHFLKMFRSRQRFFKTVFGAAVPIGLATAYIQRRPLALEHKNSNNNHAQHSDGGNSTGKSKTFTRKEVAEHKTKQTGIWVVHGKGVYDITAFIEAHPGGDKILMAAGGQVEPYWKVYTIHQKPEVRQILEQYRIGDLSDDEVDDTKNSEVKVDDPFKNDPERSPILVVRSEKPFNAETPLPLLATSYITPNEIFYKRSHLPVPVVEDADRFEVDVNGVKVSVSDLKSKLSEHQITATLQCAGNRRKEMEAAGVIQGLGWEGGAVGNAEWVGVRLVDVLKLAGVDVDRVFKDYKHVQFEGADGYGASVPIEKALDERGDVLLAYQMNGEPLLRDHGFPVRVIIPGHVAARSVKWVNKISFSNEESSSHWQQKDYKGFSPSSNWDSLNWAAAQSIQELPVQSGILEPTNNFTIPADEESVTLKGYAWSGGGRGINRVDVSIDGGKTWQTAHLVEQPDQPFRRVWAWTQWELTVDLPNDVQDDKFEVVCKAVDSSYNSQPERFDGIYNRRGVLSHAWNRIWIRREQPQSNSQSK